MSRKPAPRDQKVDPKQDKEDRFPEKGSSALIDIAKRVYMANEAMEAINLSRNMKPNGQQVLNVADKWFKAAGRVTASQEDLDYAWYNYQVIWKGDAFEAFTGYMRFNVTPATINNSNVLFNIGNAILDLYNTAVEIYHDSVVAIGTTLEKAQQIDTSKNADALIDMVIGLLNNQRQRRNMLENALNQQLGNLAKLSSQINLIRSPGKFPASVRNKGEWSYDPD